MIWLARLLILILTGASLSLTEAASVTLHPVADSSLLEVAPTNNNGALRWVNAGTTQNGPRTRGLFRFDPAAVLPTNALIVSASVAFELTGQPAMGETIPSASFGLHRMFRPWGEGTKTNGPFAIGQGQPASPGEVTWESAFHPTNHWAVPGGQAGADFAVFESASTFVEDTGNSPYTFGPTPELAADVQLWLNQPGTNFGWMLLCADEGPRFTARRFASREDVNNAPRLVVQYFVPPRFARVEPWGDFLLLSFRAEAGHRYGLEYRDALDSAAWQALADLGSFTDPVQVFLLVSRNGPQCFYRLNAFEPPAP
jgi:hypothetical protein